MIQLTQPKVVGILLVYYEKYAPTAICEFSKLIRSIDRNSKILIVVNGNEIVQNASNDVIYVAGNNSLREFSGWDRGITVARELDILDRSELTILANDTFCHHNKFGPITKNRFRSAFRNAVPARGQLSLIGERFSLGAIAEINGLRFDSWISTYLFGLSTPLLLKLHQVSPPFSINKLVHKPAERGVAMTENVSPNLARRIENWMGVSDGISSRWYGVQNGNPMSEDQYLGKVRSILCEKYLSAACIANGGQLMDVFPQSTIRQLRRIDKLLSRSIRAK